DLRADSIVAQVLLESELQIRFDGVEALVLQRVSLDLVREADSAPFLMQVDNHAGLGRQNTLDRFGQLLAAVASLRAKHVAGQALRMEPDQRRASAADVAFDQRQMLAAVNRAAKDHRLDLARADRKIDVGDTLHQQFVGQAIGNQVFDEQYREIVGGGEFAQLGQARGVAVLAQHRT